MEKVVANQIKGHVDGLGLDSSFQSAYKAFHSTETVLISCLSRMIYSAVWVEEM